MNTFPTHTSPRRLAVVAEFPMGAHQYLIDSLLASAGIDREACFIGSLSPRQGLKFNSPEVQESARQLEAALVKFEPHFILGLDRFGTVLRWLSGEKRSIDSWRGSLFMSTGSVKCLCTYHPQRLTMEYGLTGVVRFDVQKVAREMKTDGLTIPTDVIAIDDIKDLLVARLQLIQRTQTPVAVDIEGYCTGISCIGFATGPNTAFVVPFIKYDNTSYWSEADEIELWQAIRDVLEDPTVPKICHNALYELFCLAWAYGIVIQGLDHDTMVMHFELYAEMEKNLGFCTSIYTSHPYYKSDRKSTDDRTLLLYNGKDCCRTYEIWQAMTPKLQARQREHYEFNMSLLIPLAYMSLRGIRYDKDAAARRLAKVQEQIYEKQDEINKEASTSRPELAAFYEALQGGVGDTDTKTDSLSASTVTQPLHDIHPLVPIFARAFCRARCTEKREVEETTWQPMRWNGKKWVKDGKRLQARDDEQTPPSPYEHQQWLKPITKTALRNVPVEIRTFEDVENFSKDSCLADAKRASILVSSAQSKGSSWTSEKCGYLSTLLNLHIKINSTSADGDAAFYLYEHCKFPKQFQKDGNKLTDRVATDDEAIINCWLEKRDPRALTVHKIRKLITESKFLRALPDDDGRIRFGFNLVGTPTGRMAAYGSPTGTSDVNPQTWTKKMRDLLVADEGHLISNKDLAGSDGYTVAAYSAMQGDMTMLNDLKAGLKVAKIIALMIKHGPEVNTWPVEKLKQESKSVSEEAGPEYPTSKVIQHMSSYKGGPRKMSRTILMNSIKKGSGEPVVTSPEACKSIQAECFFRRYPGILRWHEWAARELKEKGMLTACNGFQRKFYGRKNDSATLGEFLAHMPQVITTYSIELTLFNQWSDPENRCEDGSLRIEPLLLVHDSNVSMWRIEDTDFAKRKLADYFNNPVTIAGTTLVIPASGSYGKDWLNQEFEL